MTPLAAILLLVMLPNGGHVRGGTEVSIQLRPSVVDLAEPLEVTWQLAHGSLVLKEGRCSVPDDGTVLTLAIPEVRALTALSWRYQLRVAGGGADTSPDGGQTTLWIHPPAEHAARGKSLARVIDEPVVYVSAGRDAGVEALLRDMGLPVLTVAPGGADRWSSASWIILGEDTLDEAAQKNMARALRRGARVMVLQQTAPASPKQAYVQRPASPVSWDAPHPLLAHVESSWLDQRVAAMDTATARRVVDDEGFYLVAGWPDPEAIRPSSDGETKPSEEKAPPGFGDVPQPLAEFTPPLLDALVWVHRPDEGVAVHWQLPVTDWSADPLASELFYNTLLYLAYPPPRPDRETQETSVQP